MLIFRQFLEILKNHDFFKKGVVFGLVFLLFTAAIASESLVPLSIETRKTTHQFQVEIAATEETRRQGLMFREALLPMHGMWFDFGKTQPVTMWMKNTPIPLDMLFVDEDGIICTIHRNAKPFSEALLRSSDDVRYVLEILGGSAERLGIRTSDQVTLPLANSH